MATISKKRPLIRYPGAKNKIAKWIIEHFPAHDTYNEPFVGSAAVLLAKKRSHMESVNDLSGDLINLLVTLRDSPTDLIRIIEMTYWSSTELETSLLPTENQTERARRFYTRCWMSMFPFDDNPSFRRQKIYSRGKSGKSSMKSAARSFMDTDHLYQISARLRGVSIENMDALDYIKLYDYDQALFYVDPPYPFSTRVRTNHYEHDDMADSDHEKLFNVLNTAAGMVVVSGYACPLYCDLYEAAGWERIDKEAQIDGADTAVESIWLSPHTKDVLQKPRQGGLL